MGLECKNMQVAVAVEDLCSADSLESNLKSLVAALVAITSCVRTW